MYPLFHVDINLESNEQANKYGINNIAHNFLRGNSIEKNCRMKEDLQKYFMFHRAGNMSSSNLDF